MNEVIALGPPVGTFAFALFLALRWMLAVDVENVPVEGGWGEDPHRREAGAVGARPALEGFHERQSSSIGCPITSGAGDRYSSARILACAGQASSRWQ